MPEWDEFNELDLIEESKPPLPKALKAEGGSMVYVYDFGDDWRHEVRLEKMIPVREVPKTRRVLAVRGNVHRKTLAAFTVIKNSWKQSSIRPTKTTISSSGGRVVISTLKSSI